MGHGWGERQLQDRQQDSFFALRDDQLVVVVRCDGFKMKTETPIVKRALATTG